MYNCQSSENCPLDGNCMVESVIYKATVNKGDKETEETYIGLTGGMFKTRYTAHLASFRHRNKASSTTLSNYIWKLKDKGVDTKISWEIVANAPSYHPNIGKCLLCLREKYFIMFGEGEASLNNRSEIASTCRHKNIFFLT